MRQIAVGTVILSIIGLIAFINHDWSLFIEVSAVVGTAGLLLAAVFSGSLGSGDRVRANYTHEEEDDRIRRRD